MKGSQEARIGRLLSSAYLLWQRETYGRLEGIGFSEVRPSHSPVFRHIDREGTRIVDLAQRAGMTKQSMAYLVRKMEECGLARVEADPQDGRARRVLLSQRGWEAEAALAQASLVAEQAMASRFGEGAVEPMRQLLADLLEWDFQGQA